MSALKPILTPEEKEAFTRLKEEFPFLEPGLSNNNAKHVGVREVFNASGRKEEAARTKLTAAAAKWTENEKLNAVAAKVAKRAINNTVLSYCYTIC